MNNKNLKRIYRVKVSFDFRELLVVKQQAKAHGRTPARYIREGILGREMKLKQFTAEEKQLFKEMTGVSRNINQIAKFFNLGDANYMELHYTVKNLQVLIDKLIGNAS